MSTPPRPAPAEPSLVLIETDRWAMDLVLDACEGLSDEQLDREFEMGLGTLRKTIVHTVSAVRGWTDVLNEADEARERLDMDEKRSIAAIRELYHASMDEFEHAAREERFANVVKPSRDGREYAFSRGGILTHVMTHSVHHRAQCLNMLRQLGVNPLPMIGVASWMVEHPPM